MASRGSGVSTLEKRLRRELEGEVRFDAFERGRYSADASIYQIEPLGVAIPTNASDVEALVSIAREEGVPIVPRGAGTSQAGQAIGEGLIVDTTKHLNQVLSIDAEARRVRVQPGIVLDRLNSVLAPRGLFFAVDPATSSRATIGGMAGNNSSGSHSVRYGIMADNVESIQAVLSDGRCLDFGRVSDSDRGLEDRDGGSPGASQGELVERMRSLRLRQADEIEARVPKILRHVAGYNLHRVSQQGFNMAELLVGSEGTLAFFTELELKLEPRPSHRTLGVCHFPSFYEAMKAARPLVGLGAAAVELFDRSLIDLGRRHPAFRGSMARFVLGEPQAILLVEFAGEDRSEVRRRLDQLEDCMSELGYSGSVVRAEDAAFQKEIWGVRKSGLNILTSTFDEAKPVAFIEDCAVPLEHLADYSQGLQEIFHRQGVQGTFYGHASVGCLHVRPLLDLSCASEVEKMRAIAQQTHELVRRFGGSHSGEHGDGIVRSEFIRPMLGDRLTRAFEEIKTCFDPCRLFNPGRIVDPPRMDDHSLLRRFRERDPLSVETALDWSKQGGLLAAARMCNNNGACRKMTEGVMCPSYRVTMDERHLTRGRANTLRLALSGQLGPEAFHSQSMREAFDLCVSCKACRSECPAGVDMARMKIEFLNASRRRFGLPLRQRMIAHLPRYAPWARRLRFLFNLRNRVTAISQLTERLLGVSAARTLPEWRKDSFGVGRGEGAGRAASEGGSGGDGAEVVLLPDTFSWWFEPENLRAAERVLGAAGYRVRIAGAADGGRPLCCGRTFLAAGMVEEARHEARRMLESLRPFVERGLPVVGLEPSCLLTLRDEIPALLPGRESAAASDRAVLVEELLSGSAASQRMAAKLRPLAVDKALLHGHCHQKAFGTFAACRNVLGMIPDLKVEPIATSCCGMAGSFGYDAEHHEISLRMAELDLLPAIRAADESTWIVADGTSCRHQIRDGCGRSAMHSIRVLDASLQGSDQRPE